MLEKLNMIFTTTNGIMWSYVLITMLISIGSYFTFKTGFVQLSMLREMFSLLKTNEKLNKEALSSFQAFCISTASRVGTGNIVGIAMAIGVGGPGAVFWMWVFAIVGSASAFIESTLAQIFKLKDQGGYKGGPAYYIEKGLKNKFLAKVFAISSIGFLGLIVHSILSNSITASLQDAFSIDIKYGTLLVVFLVFLGIAGGAQKIGKIAEVLVPFMAVIYIALALFITFKNIDILPGTIKLILESAFGFKAFGGGTLGSVIMIGIKRGLFSNEAGMGSAPNAAASASVSHPVKQGLIQTLGVFVDTLIICNATAFMILLSGTFNSGLKGISLVQTAVTSQVGAFGTVFISLSVFLFSISTIFGCYFYGETNLKYLFDNKKAVAVFKGAVLAMVVFGGMAESTLVWNMGDFFMGIMSFVNLIAIVPLSKYAFDALADYKYQKSQGLNPMYSAVGRKGLEDIDCWHDISFDSNSYVEEENEEADQKLA